MAKINCPTGKFQRFPARLTNEIDLYTWFFVSTFIRRAIKYLIFMKIFHLYSKTSTSTFFFTFVPVRVFRKRECTPGYKTTSTPVKMYVVYRIRREFVRPVLNACVFGRIRTHIFAAHSTHTTRIHGFFTPQHKFTLQHHCNVDVVLLFCSQK